MQGAWVLQSGAADARRQPAGAGVLRAERIQRLRPSRHGWQCRTVGEGARVHRQWNWALVWLLAAGELRSFSGRVAVKRYSK